MIKSTPVKMPGGGPRRRAILTSWILLAACLGVSAPAVAQDDIDAFMEEVLSRRVRNWEDLYRYTVRDRESVDVRGPRGAPVESYDAEYVWYVRDGYMVRSPQTINGVGVGEAQRERFEQRFLKRLKRQEEKAREREESADPGETMEREYFLGFPFEPGNYFLAGRETIDGRDLLRIEYYPEKLFEEAEEEDGDEDPGDEEFVRRFQKTSRVTLWVLPEERQIVRITFDNVGLQFLPLRWLVQVDDISATLTMHWLEPEQVWLPRAITARGQATIATGTFELDYSLEYFDYRRAAVEARVRYALPEQDQ